MCCHDEKNTHVNTARENREEQLLLLTAVFCPSLPLTKATEYRLCFSSPLFMSITLFVSWEKTARSATKAFCLKCPDAKQTRSPWSKAHWKYWKESCQHQWALEHAHCTSSVSAESKDTAYPCKVFIIEEWFILWLWVTLDKDYACLLCFSVRPNSMPV